jgi:hypothetical protein
VHNLHAKHIPNDAHDSWGEAAIGLTSPVSRAWRFRLCELKAAALRENSWWVAAIATVCGFESCAGAVAHAETKPEQQP